jgi:hypothetical protein
VGKALDRRELLRPAVLSAHGGRSVEQPCESVHLFEVGAEDENPA